MDFSDVMGMYQDQLEPPPADVQQGIQLGKRKRMESSEGVQPVNTGSIKREKSEGVDVSAFMAEGFNYDEHMEKALVPTAEECLKLRSVVRMLDKHGIGTERLPEEAGVATFLDALEPEQPGFPHTVSTLQYFLDIAVASVQAEQADRQKKGKGREQANGERSGASDTQEDERKRVISAKRQVEGFVKVIHGIFEELREAAAKRMNYKRRKDDKPKYALHRTIGNMDVFTSAADVKQDDPVFQALKDTDVLAVYPSAPAKAKSIPKLGDINTLPNAKPKDLEDYTPRTEPVTFLYYDPYASFAPTYDSSTSSLSYAQSVALRQSRVEMKDWAKRPLPPLPPHEPAGPVRESIAEGLGEIDPALLGLDVGKEPKAVQQGPERAELAAALRSLEDSAVIDKRLEENAALLRLLQEAQWERLRKEADAEQQRPTITLAPTPSVEETASASRLLESFKSIVNARPRVYDELSRSDQTLFLPSDKTAYLRLASNAIQPESAVFYGILDKANSKAIRDSLMTGTPAAMAARLRLLEQKGKGGAPGMDRKMSSAGKKGAGGNVSGARKKAKSETPGLVLPGTPA